MKAVGLNTEQQAQLVVTLVEEEGNFEKTKKRFATVVEDGVIEKFKGYAFHTAEKLHGLKIPDHAKQAVEEHRKLMKISAANKEAKRRAFEAAGGVLQNAAVENTDPLK